MDETLFERLLWQDESERLDFKLPVYHLEHAYPDERIELAKDLVGFANAWRDDDAYILIGVEEVRGGRSIVVGINPHEHLADHALQQFVRGLTDHPINCLYQAFAFEGKEVGVIRIDAGPRPFRMAKDVGPLRRGEVYVRRGSQTDPQRPATEDEVQQMRAAARPRQADLVVEFTDARRDASLGTGLTWSTEACRMPEKIEDHDDLDRARMNVAPITTFQSNRAYFREVAEYERLRRLVQRTRLLVRNVGRVPAQRVLVEMAIANDGADVEIYESLPDAPLPGHPGAPRIRLAHGHPGRVVVDTEQDGYRLQIDCGDMQPGRFLVTDWFYAGRATSGDIVFDGRIYADNLERPSEFTLRIVFNVQQSAVTSEELKTFARKGYKRK